jgi:uncharacterized protein (TIGR03067 family)
MVRALLLPAVAALCLAPVSADDKQATGDKKADKHSLDGTYTIVSGEKDGKPLPPDHFRGAVITFKGDKAFGTDKDKKEFFACTYKLDTSAVPWKVKMTSVSPKEGEKAEGIVQVQGETVKLCYALPGGDAPTEFKTKAKQHCFTLQRTDGGKATSSSGEK